VATIEVLGASRDGRVADLTGGMLISLIRKLDERASRLVRNDQRAMQARAPFWPFALVVEGAIPKRSFLNTHSVLRYSFAGVCCVSFVSAVCAWRRHHS
jgi:hypothetical protein